MVRRPIALALSLAGLMGCAPPPPPPPPPAPAPSPAPLPPPPIVTAEREPDPPALEAPVAPPREVKFGRGAPYTFRVAGGLSITRVARSAQIHALSPDGSRMVLSRGKRLQLTTVDAAESADLEGAGEAPSAVFSPDNALVAIGGERLRIYDAANGVVLRGVDQASCAQRFTGDGAVLFHERSNKETARLWRLDLGDGSVTPLSKPQRAVACAASRDGKRWILDGGATHGLVFIEGSSGRARKLADGGAGAMPSPAADWWCAVPQRRNINVWCERVDDGGRAVLIENASHPSLRFDAHGGRALLGVNISGDPSNPRHAWHVVSFGEYTVRPLEGFFEKTGSIPRLLPDGALLAMGGAKGMTIYDLERGERRFANVDGHPLYAAYGLFGHPRLFAAGSESPSGRIEDAYIVEVP